MMIGIVLLRAALGEVNSKGPQQFRCDPILTKCGDELRQAVRDERRCEAGAFHQAEYPVRQHRHERVIGQQASEGDAGGLYARTPATRTTRAILATIYLSARWGART